MFDWSDLQQYYSTHIHSHVGHLVHRDLTLDLASNGIFALHGFVQHMKIWKLLGAVSRSWPWVCGFLVATSIFRNLQEGCGKTYCRTWPDLVIVGFLQLLATVATPEFGDWTTLKNWGFMKVCIAIFNANLSHHFEIVHFEGRRYSKYPEFHYQTHDIDAHWGVSEYILELASS